MVEVLLALALALARAAPTVSDQPESVVITGSTYELRLSKVAGVFEFLIDPDGDGAFTSVRRPNGEPGWYGYEAPGGGRNTFGAAPTVTVRADGPRPVIRVETVLDPATGATHTAQYACFDDFVLVVSRYGPPAPAGGADLVRTGPKLDVDIGLLPTYAFRDRHGELHTGTLAEKQRSFYAGARAWEGGDQAEDFSTDAPYEMLLDPATGAKLAVVYPFSRDVWWRQPRFLQLWTDGGNFWYTGVGTASAFGKDYAVCLYSDRSPDQAELEGRIADIIASAESAVRDGEVQAVIERRPRPEDGPLYLLSYDHAVGYPKIQDEARKSVAFLDQYPELKIGLQAEGWTWDWLARNDPAFVDEARGWMGRYPGRWVPGGGSYGQPYFTFISEESGIRQMLYGTRAIKEHLGYDNTIYIYSEHETGPHMPMLLEGMGYRGAFFRTHMTYGGDGPSMDADWVLWTGPDGSSIPAVPAYTGREHGLGNEWLLINYTPGIYWFNGPAWVWEDVDDFKTEMLARGVRYPIVSRCEDWYTRPSKELLDDARARQDQGTQWVTAEDYFGVLERSGVQPRPFVAGPNDFPTTQPWGYTGNRTWTGPRVAAGKVLTAEALASAAILHGMAWTEADQRKIDDAWKNLLIAEHHDSLICAIYNEGRDFTVPSEQASADVASRAAEYLARQSGGTGDRVLVFNPTAHARTEPVRIPGAVTSATVTEPGGAEAPCQADADGAWFLARSVPPLGYRVYSVEQGTAKASAAPAGAAFRTDRYDVEFSPDGGLTRLTDRASGRDLVPLGRRTGVLEGLVGSDSERSSGSVTVTAAGPVVWRAVERGQVGAVAYEVTYAFAAESPAIDIHIRLDIPQGTRIGCPEAEGTPESRRGGIFHRHGYKLRYLLDTPLAGPRAVRHLPFIISELPPGTETVDANLWAALETDSAGMAVANRGSMGYRAVGSRLEAILAYSGEYVWGDNFLNGAYDYDYRVIPYGGAADRGAAQRLAVEFDRPLYAHAYTGGAAAGPREWTAASLEAGGDAVGATALFPQDGGVFLRLCDMSDNAAEVGVVQAVSEVNLALTKDTPITQPIRLRPWHAHTVRLK